MATGFPTWKHVQNWRWGPASRTFPFRRCWDLLAKHPQNKLIKLIPYSDGSKQKDFFSWLQRIAQLQKNSLEKEDEPPISHLPPPGKKLDIRSSKVPGAPSLERSDKPWLMGVPTSHPTVEDGGLVFVAFGFDSKKRTSKWPAKAVQRWKLLNHAIWSLLNMYFFGHTWHA